jgi:hypothetical protein
MNWGLVRAGGLDYGGPEIRISSDEKTLQVQGAIFTKPLLISEIYQTPRSNDFGERAYDLKSTFIRMKYLALDQIHIRTGNLESRHFLEP